MKRLLTYLAILFVMHFECIGQNYFNFTDTVFTIGQIRKIEMTYDLSGGWPRAECVPLLDSICDFLKKNKNLKIEIGVHTDYRGDTLGNRFVSEMRARRVIEYFNEKGIDLNRLEHKGYGEYYPIVVDKKINELYPFFKTGQKLTENYIKKLDSKEKQEIANILNHRTEIKILKTNMP